MTKVEYLDQTVELLNNGNISKEAYELMTNDVDAFSEEEVITEKFSDQQKILDARISAIDALKELKVAWCYCNEVFSNIHFKTNDYIKDNYPFEKSFDEIDVIAWVEGSIENIRNNLP